MIAVVNIPDDINEINLYQFQDWMENPKDIKRKLAIFLQIDFDKIDIIQDEYIAEINEELDELLNKPNTYTLRLLIDGKPYNFISDLNKISFGEYIDICTYITKVEHWHRLMAVVFKPDNKDDKYEGTGDIKDVFLTTPLGEVTAAVNMLAIFLKDIQSQYPEIYKGGSSEGADAQNYFQKWGWYATIKALSKNKPWKVSKITDMNIHEIHNFLAADIDEKKFKHKLATKGADDPNTIYL
jgi:hypothetical protein